jgi:hypothetical protein
MELMSFPIARYCLYLRCPACQRGYYAEAPVARPQVCPTCAGGRPRPTGDVWDLATERWPPLLAYWQLVQAESEARLPAPHDPAR